MARQFRFVAINDPRGATSSESRGAAYSHAFRQAHAQRRRLQMQRHTTEKSDTEPNHMNYAPHASVWSPTRQVLNSNTDLFSCLARPLAFIECRLLHHYVNVALPFTIGHCNLLEHSREQLSLMRDWVGLAVADHTFMTAAVLLSTCRYLLRQQPGELVLEQLALQYKQTCLRTMRQEMDCLPGPASIMTIAKALALALDEVAIGEELIAQKHLRGVIAMINSSDGATAVDLPGLLGRIYRRCLQIWHLDESEVVPIIEAQ